MTLNGRELGTDLRIPKYCRPDDIESPTDEYSLNYLPYFMSFGSKKNGGDGDEDEDEEIEEEETEDLPRSTTQGELNKWDKGARSWLSAGTLFLLIILFHVIQMRSDLRRFTSAANTQIAEVCGVLEDKTGSLQMALGLAAKDVGPITLKFVRDLKTKIRSTFHFAGQIFGGRIRTYLMSLLSYKYCLLVGIIVVLKSLVTSILKYLFTTVEIVKFITKPEEFFASLLDQLLDIIFDPEMFSITIPGIGFESSAVCLKLQRLKFDEIEQTLQSYVNKLIIVLAVMLVLYNTVQFIITVEVESKNDDLKAETEDEEFSTVDESLEEGYDDDDNEEEYDEDDEDEERESTVNNVLNWVFNFLSYEPFWIFLTMGIFGVLHAYFSLYLHHQAQEIKKTVIDPQVEIITQQFTEEISNFLTTLEDCWSGAFKEVMRPITDFVKHLSDIFGPTFQMISDFGTGLLDCINTVLEYLNQITVVKEGIMAVLDCLILGKIKFFIKIAKMISEKLLGNQWNNYEGGIVHLLKNSITSIFRRLKVTKYLKKMISVSFLMFLRLVAKRSIFLYVYLIVCAILISQGLIMIIVKWFLGDF